jgi:hypothetical protein
MENNPRQGRPDVGTFLKSIGNPGGYFIARPHPVHVHKLCNHYHHYILLLAFLSYMVGYCQEQCTRSTDQS